MRARVPKKSFHINYQVRWRNYRAFEDTGWITIKPITILIGPNNSGKSSVISPLLLLRQTIGSPDSAAALVTRRPLADVGGYKDFVYGHDVSKAISLGLRYHVHDLPKRVKNVGSYPPGAVELTFRSKISAGETSNAALKSIELKDIFNRPYLRRTLTRSGRYNLSGVVSKRKMEKREGRPSMPQSL